MFCKFYKIFVRLIVEGVDSTCVGVFERNDWEVALIAEHYTGSNRGDVFVHAGDCMASAGIEAIGKRGYTYDILIFPHQLVSSLELAKLFPDYKFVIDHLAKPYAKAGYFTGWAAGMEAIAKFPNVYCKLPGLITEAAYKTWTKEELLPYLRHALEIFGPERCMFGSDWPVCRVAGDYGRVKGLIETLLEGYSLADREAVWGGIVVGFMGFSRMLMFTGCLCMIHYCEKDALFGRHKGKNRKFGGVDFACMCNAGYWVCEVKVVVPH